MGKEVITTGIVDAAIEAVAGGASLARTALALGVKRQSLYAAIKRVDALDRYEDAQRQAADALAEEIIEISDTEKDANRSRVRVDARKWLAGKFLPRKYGDRLELSVHQPPDLLAALTAARGRVGLIARKDEAEDAEIVPPDTARHGERGNLPAPDAAVPCGTQADPLDIFSLGPTPAPCGTQAERSPK